MEVIPGVHAIDLGMVHAYLYAEADRLTLIDAGLSTHVSRILEEIDAIGCKPRDLKQVVMTHYHVDHSGGAAELVDRSGAQVLAHTLDAPIIRGVEQEQLPVFQSDVERQAHERITADIPSFRSTAVDRELADGDEIDLDGGATVVHVPGHTAGSIAIHLPKRRALFVGDAAARMPDGQLIVGVFNADPEQARRSFAKLAELEFDVALFGHGAPLDKDACVSFRKLAEKLAKGKGSGT